MSLSALQVHILFSGNRLPAVVTVAAYDAGRYKIRDCMIPRTEIIAVDFDTPLTELKKVFIENGISKIIVQVGTSTATTVACQRDDDAGTDVGAFGELVSVLLESVCVLVLVSVFVALESDPLSWTTTTLVLLDGLSSVF